VSLTPANAGLHSLYSVLARSGDLQKTPYFSLEWRFSRSTETELPDGFRQLNKHKECRNFPMKTNGCDHRWFATPQIEAEKCGDF